MAFPKEHNYKPLYSGLTIKESDIEGLGLFAAQDFKSSFLFLGQPTHVAVLGNLIRTPMGGFINHSDNPNCTLICLFDGSGYFHLQTTKEVYEGDELTVDYNSDDCMKVRLCELYPL